jgi:hypothetical protein
MAKVLIEFETNLGSLEAAISKVEQNTDQLSESAAAAGKKVSEEYRKVAASAKAAFASSEVDSAIKAQAANVDKLSENLEVLYKEELRLLKLNKQASDEFKKNQAAIAATRQEFEKLRATQQGNNKETEQANNKAKSLTGQLRALKEQLSQLEQQGKENTKEFLQIAVAAGRLEDQIGDTRERVKSLSSDTFVFDAAIDSLNAVAGGFAVVQGAVGLFAEDNEELQRAIAKTNSALAILNGLQQVQAFLTGKSAGNIARQEAAQRLYNSVATTGTAVVRTFNAALVGLGIGAVITGIGFLINEIINFKSENDKLSESIERSNEVLENGKKAVKSFQERIQEARQRILLANGDITQSQFDLNKQLTALSKETQDLYQPLNEELAKYKKQLADLNKESERQNTIIGTGAAANFSAIEAQERRAKIEAEIAKIEARKEEISKNNIELQKLLIIESNKAAEQNEKNTTKSIELREKFETVTLNSLKALKLVYDQESELINDITEQYTAFLRTREQQLIRQIALEQDANKSTLESTKELIRIQGELQKEQAKATIKNREELTATINRIDTETQLKIQEEIEKTNQKLEEEAANSGERIIQTTLKYIGAVKSVFDSVVELQNQLTEQRIEQIERLRDVELEAINVASKSEAQKQREREALELRTNRKIIEERRKIARLNKAQGIFDAVVNTAVAVTNALKEDFPLNVILAAAAGVAGGVQIAKISSEPLPSFGRGGWIDGEPHTRGGVDINAEGGEFVTRASEARKNRKELEAMNTSRASFLKLIEENYVKPRLMAATLERDRNGVSVNVNARLNSGEMESELRGLRQETRKTGKIMQKLVASSNSSRYNW